MKIKPNSIRALFHRYEMLSLSQKAILLSSALLVGMSLARLTVHP